MMVQRDMGSDSNQIVKFFGNQALVVLFILSAACAGLFAMHVRADISPGSIGAVIGIFLCVLSARTAESKLDKLLVAAGIIVTFLFQCISLHYSTCS